MKNISRGLLILVILVLSGCAMFNQKAVIRDRTANKSIGVVSNFDNNLHIYWGGATFLNNEKGIIPIPDWNVNEIITKIAIEDLQATKRYKSVSAISGITRKSEGFPQVLKDRKIDILVLIEPNKILDVWEGFGIEQSSMLSMRFYTQAYFVIKGEVFDVQSGELIGSDSIEPLFFKLKTIRVQHGPTISDSALSQLREFMTTLAQAAAQGILIDLGLITEKEWRHLEEPNL